MNETTYIYIVHSDINENNIYSEFAIEEEAIDYARRHKDELTYVDKVEVALDEDGEIIEMFDSETIWVYDDEFDGYTDDNEENAFDTDFDGGYPLDEGINLKNDAERKEFFQLCDEIGIYTDKDIVNFKKEVGCTDENILQALRDYRAELGPDFKIADPELEKEMAKKYEGIDFDALVEELEENEDMVECKECFDLVAKESCTKGEHGYVCEKCNKSLDEEIKGDAKLYNCFFDGDYVGDVYAENEMEAYAEMEATWPEYCYTFCDGIATVELADEEELEEEIQEQSTNLEENKSQINMLEVIKETVDKKGHDYWVYGGSGYVARCIEIVKEGDNYVANEYVSTESGNGDTDPEYITDSTDFKEVIKVLLDEKFFDVEDRTYQEVTKEEVEEYLFEAIKMTRDELMDKEGTDDVELINAGRPEEERVELVEDASSIIDDFKQGFENPKIRAKSYPNGIFVFLDFVNDKEKYLRLNEVNGQYEAYWFETKTNWQDVKSEEKIIGKFNSFEEMIKYLADNKWFTDDSEITLDDVATFLK